MGTPITMTRTMTTTIPATRRGGTSRAPRTTESGFSLLEVVISMAVLTVGLVSLLGVFGLAMAATQTSQQDMIAKQLANEALESIITARNTSQIGWDDIQNVGAITCVSGAASCGIFLNGANPIYLPGTTGSYAGIVGTSNYLGEQTLQAPGPDGIYGTSDDVVIPLTGYQRTILISPVYDNGNLVSTLRQVNVTVQYATTQNRLPKSFVLSSFISQYQ
jgi:type II secretory pathway pseudopilin PulG